MPKDTIARAVKRGAGAQEGENYEEVRYEGYGPSGVAVMVDCLTDNINRTVSEVRHAFTKSGGNLGTDGSVAYLFSKRGMINFAPGADEEKILDVALEAGAEDIENEEDGSILVTTPWETLGDVVDALRAASLEPDNAEVSMVPSSYTPCDDELAANVLKLLDALEELDDVQNVYSNADLPESAFAD